MLVPLNIWIIFSLNFIIDVLLRQRGFLKKKVTKNLADGYKMGFKFNVTQRYKFNAESFITLVNIVISTEYSQ